ncbi:hypothetical protein BC830DRAFT_282714 [Chytriomyces sp. MP71]|nr:hypothetical protein BC830DRAFT_282714 [Chytriomyces sp. MP71]
MPQAQSQQPPNASAPRSKRTKPNSAEKNGYSTVPPAFTPLASSASHPPADSSFWSDSKDRQHTITLRTTLENLFKSSSKTLNITRTIYVVAPRTSSSLSKKTTYLPQQDRQQVSIQLNATKHYDGCTILLPGLGDQIHPSNAPASFLKRGSGRPQSSLQFKDLVLTLKVQPHPTLSRTLQDKDNLIGQLTVTKRVAAAGCAGVTFVGIDGRLLDCSSGNVHLKDGDSFVIKNEGWVKENGTGRGDLVLSVKVLPGLDDDEEDGMSHPEDGQDKEEEVDRGARKEDVGKMNDELLNGKASETGFRKRKRGESDFEQQEEEDLIGLTDPRNRDGHRKGGMDVRSESNGSVKPTHDTATTQPWMLYAEETSCESEGFDLDLDFLGGRMWTSAAREPQVSSNTENRKYPRDTSIHAPSQDSTPSAEESSKLTSTPMTEQKPQNHLRNANSKDLEDGQHNETQFSRFPLFSGKPRRKLSSQSKTPPSGHENDIASPCKDEVEATKKQNSKQKKRGVSLQGRFGPYTILGGNGGKDDPLEID